MVSRGFANVTVMLEKMMPAGTLEVFRNAVSVSSCFTSTSTGLVRSETAAVVSCGWSLAPVTLISNDSTLTPLGGVSRMLSVIWPRPLTREETLEVDPLPPARNARTDTPTTAIVARPRMLFTKKRDSLGRGFPEQNKNTICCGLVLARSRGRNLSIQCQNYLVT